MTAEDWLRERGIEVTRQGNQRPGQVAGQHTSALPHFPGADEDVTGQETQHVPSVVRIDVRLGGDVAEWPTAALPWPTALTPDAEDASIFIGDFDELSYALEDEMTVPLPVIPALPSATPPPHIIIDAEVVPPPHVSDISATPTRRLDS
jgi:hypothetical protein